MESEKDVTDGLTMASYVQDTDGKHKLQSGFFMCRPVAIANQQAWDEIEKKIEQAKQKIQQGKASCLFYYMVANHMDTSLLAQYTQQPRLLVFLHTLPFFFKRLGNDRLKKYAELFDITAEDLKKGKLLSPVYGTNDDRHYPSF